jgi:fructose-bisphosphate aldolase class I
MCTRVLVTRGRGVLGLDRPCPEIHAMLARAGAGATEERCRELRALALAAPGLDRVIGGLLVGPHAVRAAVAARRGPALQVGVRMPADAPDGPDDLARHVARHVADGASFACRAVQMADDRPDAAREVAEWAAACRHGGLVPLLGCRSTTPPRSGLAESEHAHTTAIAAVITALHRAGVDPATVLLGIRPVVPGHRSWQADAAEDVAVATVRSLREAGACAVAGVVVSPPRRDRQLAAHLSAMQWLRPGWPIGFCLGTTVLAPVAAVWRGRPDRVGAAQRELCRRFTATSAVLRAGMRELPVPRARPVDPGR